jgi:two-component system KDP operon response regulator KdpE
MEKMPQILIIDDDQALLEELASKLSSKYQITVATTGRSGLELVAEKKFDLVIFDLALSDTGGGQIVSKIRKQYNQEQLPIVLLSSFLDRSRNVLEFLKKWQVNDLISKPVNLTKLLESIQAALSKAGSAGEIKNNENSPFQKNYLTHTNQGFDII